MIAELDFKNKFDLSVTIAIVWLKYSIHTIIDGRYFVCAAIGTERIVKIVFFVGSSDVSIKY